MQADVAKCQANNCGYFFGTAAASPAGLAGSSVFNDTLDLLHSCAGTAQV